jgi:hypothetical protein
MVPLILRKAQDKISHNPPQLRTTNKEISCTDLSHTTRLELTLMTVMLVLLQFAIRTDVTSLLLLERCDYMVIKRIGAACS